MHVVALIELGTSIDAEAPLLASDLGTIAYEARLVLNAGCPAIVQKSAEREPAQKLLAKLRARGHVAVAFDASKAVPHERMVAMKQFTLDADGATEIDGPKRSLPFSDVLAILRATHRTRLETQTEVKETKFNMGRAVLTGGLMLTSKVKRQESSIHNETEQVLYLFRASGETPWLLRERGANYAPLGEDLQAASAQNFITMIARLRKCAPSAIYDDRLMAPRSIGGRVAHHTTSKSEIHAVTSAGGVDLLAHAIALSAQTEALRP